jgi:hypothetical protein
VKILVFAPLSAAEPNEGRTPPENHPFGGNALTKDGAPSSPPSHQSSKGTARMKRLIVTVVALAALALPSLAAGHGTWYNTRYNTERGIYAKFPRVSVARCSPLPAWARSRYGADSFVSGGVRRWNHFFCGVYVRSGAVCFLVFHHTSQYASQGTVTSWQRQGCSTRALRGG